ncbi:MAG: hypothetical protein BWY47_01909 [Bacteroidetes bacterium ADurb.Bin302]|nr:MAG: hypothetical protein BWY47_01909 [Bacteroidetes bacterium ADurb.Bin302]
MYNDHKKGFNQNLADRARTILLLKRYSTVGFAKREFDEYGDVVRDYKKELEIYASDELINLLPQVSGEYFHSCQSYHLYRKKHINDVPEVKIVPQLKRTKVLKKQNVIARLKAVLRPSIPKFTHAFRSLW